LPFGEFVQDSVRHPGDQVRRDVYVIHLAQVRADVPVVIPRAYKAMIRSLNPSSRVCP